MKRPILAMLNQMHRTLLFSIAMCLFVFCYAGVLEACPTCKDNLAGDPTAEGLARGFYYSILLMISMPFLILGSLCAYFYFLVRQAEWEKQRLLSVTHSLDATASS